MTVPDSFFGGHTPGSRTFSRLQSLSPTKAAPIAALAVSDTILEVKEEEEKEEDTQIMLERMKQMVEGVKQRQSMGPRPSVGTGLSPRKPSGFSLLAPGGEESAPRIFDAEQVEDESFDKENEPKTEDVEMTVAEESSEPKPIFRAPTTPKFSGMREMFREAAEEMHTPKMDGLRNLFRPERVSETPAFEGLGEMLVTPSEYQEKEPLPELEKPKPIPARMAQSRKPPSTSRLPATTRRTVTRSALPRTESPVEKIPEEAGPSNLPEAKQKLTAARVSRKPRSRTADTQEVSDLRTRGTPKAN